MPFATRISVLRATPRAHWWHFGLLLGVSILVYAWVYSHLHVGVSEEVMYASRDATGHQKVVTWLTEGKYTGYTRIRPLFYPILLAISDTLGGVWGTWGLHLLLWLGTVQLVFWASFRFSERWIVGYVSAALLLSNLSLIAMTLHALTEVTTTFMLAALAWLLAKRWRQMDHFRLALWVLGLLALLTCTRPSFYLPFLCTVAGAVVLHHKTLLTQPRRWLFLLLAISPVLVQVTLMKVRHDTWQVSEIGGNTFRLYYMTRLIETQEGISHEAAVDKSKAMNFSDQLDYLSQHSEAALTTYWTTVQDNLQEECSYLKFPAKVEHPIYYSYMETLNGHYYSLHRWMIGLVVFWLMLLAVQRQWKRLLVVFYLSLLCLFYLLISGFSYYQGDRLVLPAIALWAVLYPVGIADIVRSTGRFMVRKLLWN
ncbi:MAG: hypothetical protein ACFB10_22470 [Salibacteraceae bacterium]